MSQVNFENLHAEFPSLSKAWGLFKIAFESGRLDVRDLGGHPDVPIGDLAKALTILLKRGQVTCVFRIEAPDGTFVGEPYRNLSDLPASSWDRFHTSQFDVDPEENVVPVYSLIN